MSIFGSDFETDIIDDEARVVQWVIWSPTRIREGMRLYEWIDAIRELCYEHMAHSVYFHNIDYDGKFFLPALAEMCDLEGWKLDITANNDKKLILISIRDGKKTILDFRDSYKIVAKNLAEIGDLLGVPKLEGVGGDWHEGWSLETDFTNEEQWIYVRRDAEICQRIAATMAAEGLDRPTLAGCALKYAKILCNLTVPFAWMDIFPPLHPDVYNLMKESYYGGENFSAGKMKITENVKHYDVTSLYPSVMMFDRLPEGRIFRVNKDRTEGRLYVEVFSGRINVKPGGLPWFKFKMSNDAIPEGITASDPVEHCALFHRFVLTSVDIAELEKDYDIERDGPSEYYIFENETVGRFKPYLDHWFAKKKEHSPHGSNPNETLRMIDKLMLNSLYGRMGLTQTFTDTVLAYDEEIDYMVMKNENEHIEMKNNSYMPFAAFVTANARRRWLELARPYYQEDRLIHGDTDSIIVYGDRVGPDELYGDELGQWKDELEDHEDVILIEGGIKKYIELFKPLDGMKKGMKLDDFINVTISGVPQKFEGGHPYRYGCPVGMWVEILDDPDIMKEDLTLGNTDYKIKSQWLRDLYVAWGKDPDHVNTMKLIPENIKGGVRLVQRQYNTATAGFAVRFRS